MSPDREAANPEVKRSVRDRAAVVPVAQQGTPPSAEQDASQAGHLVGGVIVFLVLAVMLLLVWLAIRGLLERIWRPTCFLVSCEAQAQTQPQPPPPPPPQTQPQSQPQPQPPHQPSRQRPRPHIPYKIVVGDCLPPGYWGYYSWRLRDPPRRWPVECWRYHRGPCID